MSDNPSVRRTLASSTLLALLLGCGPASPVAGSGATETGAGDDEPCVDEPLPEPANALADRQPAIVDLDGDGHLDVVALRASDLELLWGDGQGGFEVELVESFASDYGRILVGDVDGDQRLDVLAYEHGDYAENRATVGLQSSPRVFGPAQTSALAGLWDTRELMPAALVDVDEDGDADLVLGDPRLDATVNLSTALSDGLGGFAEPVSASWTMSCATEQLVAADLDGSGGDELVVVDTGRCAGAVGSSAAVVSLAADGEATLVDELELGPDPVGSAPAIADFDGDGTLDLVVATTQSIHLFRGLGDASFEPVAIVPAPAESFGLGAVLAGQLDGEGGPELFVQIVADDGERLAWLLHSLLDAAKVSAPEPFEAHWYLYSGDFDEDGCDDLLFARPADPPGDEWFLRRCPGAC